MTVVPWLYCFISHLILFFCNVNFLSNSFHALLIITTCRLFWSLCKSLNVYLLILLNTLFPLPCTLSLKIFPSLCIHHLIYSVFLSHMSTTCFTLACCLYSLTCFLFVFLVGKADKVSIAQLGNALLKRKKDEYFRKCNLKVHLL